MRLATYLLFVCLLSLIGLCTVHESVASTRVRYKISSKLSREQELTRQLDTLKIKLDSYSTPVYLEWANYNLKLQRRRAVQDRARGRE